MMKLKAKLINYLLGSVCNTLTFDEVLTVTRKRSPAGTETLEMKIGKREVPESEFKVMVADAKYIQKLHLWPKLLGDMKSLATDRLVNKSESLEDMVFSKAILYTLDVLEKKVDQIAAL